MPRKTHRRIFCSSCRPECCLKPFWRVVSQCRMETLGVVIDFHKRSDIPAQLFHPAILVGADFFTLESLHEALAFRVIPWIGQTTHAGNNLVLVQGLAVFCLSVLDPAIGMMYETRRGRATDFRVLQGSYGEL